MPCNGPRSTYFGKLLVIVVKWAKVELGLCNCAKLGGALQVMQIHLLLVCCWSGQSCTYSIDQPYIMFIHPILLQFSNLGLDWAMLVPNCSLRVCCNCTKLVGALQLIQICFLLVWSQSGLGCAYSIIHIMCSSIPYSSTLFWLLFLLFCKISHL
jgi:hypothetical protein